MSKNVERDAYLTPKETTDKIVKIILEKFPEWQEKEWFEPSAGSGNFIKSAIEQGVKATGVDIKPLDHIVKEGDFLTDEFDLTDKIVFGNPPYGKYNNLSIAFINKAFNSGAEYVAFLLTGSMMLVSRLKNINGEVIYCERINTTFIFEDGKNDNYGISKIFSTFLIIYKKIKQNIDYKIFKNKPYCYQGHLDSYDYAMICGESILKINDTNEYKKSNEQNPREVYRLAKGKMKYVKFLKFYNIDDYYENIELIKIIQKFVLHDRPTPQSINYLLSIKDRIKF